MVSFDETNENLDLRRRDDNHNMDLVSGEHLLSVIREV